MHETVRFVLSLSLSGSVLAVLLLAAEPFLKRKVSWSLHYLLWVVVLIRLLVPFSFEGSIMDRVFAWNHSPAAAVLQVQEAGKRDENQQPAENETAAVPSPEAERPSGSHAATPALVSLFYRYAFSVWLVGFLLALVYQLFGYYRFIRAIHASSSPATEREKNLLAQVSERSVRVRLVLNRHVGSPLLIGLLRPTIVLPAREIPEVQLRTILLHELTHLRRFDLIVKWGLTLASAVHWFNPLMYWVRHKINHVCELSCDETVVRKLDSSEREAYGHALLTAASVSPSAGGRLGAMFSSGKSMLKERLVSIMRPVERTKGVKVRSSFFLALVIFGAVALGAGSFSAEPILQPSNPPVTPPHITITHDTHPDPIENYRILTGHWAGMEVDRMTFYQVAWHSEPTLLTGLHRPKPLETFQLDFGSHPPDRVIGRMAYLTESLEQSLLPYVELPMTKQNGSVYTFRNPPASTSGISTSGRVYSITVTWGDNQCEYVFASDGKFDGAESDPGEG